MNPGLLLAWVGSICAIIVLLAITTFVVVAVTKAITTETETDESPLQQKRS